MTTNIAAFLDAAATAEPGRPALIVDDGTVCGYGDLQGEVGRWASTLAAAGVAVGDRVALADWGGVRSTAVTLAAAHLGAATAQMNPLLTADELAQLVATAGCGPVGVADAGAAAALERATGAPAATSSCSGSLSAMAGQSRCRLRRWCLCSRSEHCKCRSALPT